MSTLLFPIRILFPVPRSASMRAIDACWRAALVLLLGALLLPSLALAQDPRASAPQRVARQWLALADKLDAEATWKAAGERFQKTMTLRAWTLALGKDRAPSGALVQRAIISTSVGSKLKGLPDGNYALIQFRTSFAKRPNSTEHVTLEQGPDGSWRVIGYVIA